MPGPDVAVKARAPFQLERLARGHRERLLADHVQPRLQGPQHHRVVQVIRRQYREHLDALTLGEPALDREHLVEACICALGVETERPRVRAVARDIGAEYPPLQLEALRQRRRGAMHAADQRARATADQAERNTTRDVHCSASGATVATVSRNSNRKTPETTSAKPDGNSHTSRQSCPAASV